MTTRRSSRPPVRKRFGQHFLEATWAGKVVHAIAPSPDQTFLEIGPGRGAITHLLAADARAVVAFEIDRDLSVELRRTARPNVRVVDGDFLEINADRIRRELADVGGAHKVRSPPDDDLTDPRAAAAPDRDLNEPRQSPAASPDRQSVRVAGNLPYNVASPILFKLVELFAEGIPFTDASIMLQREVANRLLAAPGTKDYGVLAILIGRHARVERLLQLPAGAFRPAPKVQSTVVRLWFHQPEPPVSDERVFRALTQAIFTRRRKTLLNALLAYPPLASAAAGQLLEVAGLDPQRRPETLSIGEMGRLSDLVSQAVL